jgi:glycosyltransferase involved in cell wall biosynthesis
MYCYWLGGTTRASLRRNLTLANSNYIASLFEAYHHVKPHIVVPPAPGHVTVQPWAEKKEQMVCLGRLAPEKDLPKIIEIIRQLRARGHALSLIVIGTWNCSGAYRRHLHRLVEQHRDWVRLEQDLSRQEVVRLLAVATASTAWWASILAWQSPRCSEPDASCLFLTSAVR